MIFRSIFYVLIIFYLSGCGQTGPLYLPAPDQKETKADAKN